MARRIYPTNAPRGGSTVLTGSGSNDDIFYFPLPCQIILQNKLASGTFSFAQGCEPIVPFTTSTTTVTAGVTTTITLASINGFAVGQSVVVDQGGANPDTVTVASLNVGAKTLTFASAPTHGHSGTYNVTTATTYDETNQPLAASKATAGDYLLGNNQNTSFLGNEQAIWVAVNGSAGVAVNGTGANGIVIFGLL